MDEKSKAELDRITAAGPNNMTQFDRDFLYARREYLTKAQRDEFKEVIEAKYEEVKQAAEEVEAEEKPKEEK